MILAKAQACAAAISGAGFDVQMRKDPVTGDWTVRASSATLNIAVAAADSLAISQGVNGNVALVEYV